MNCSRFVAVGRQKILKPLNQFGTVCTASSQLPDGLVLAAARELRHERELTACSDYGNPEQARPLRVETGHTSLSNQRERKIYSIVQALIGFATFALVIAGVGGTIYKLVSPGGWVAQAFGTTSAGTAVLGSLALLVALASLSRGGYSPRHPSRHAGLFVYAFAAAGLLYLAQYWIKGTL